MKEPAITDSDALTQWARRKLDRCRRTGLAAAILYFAGGSAVTLALFCLISLATGIFAPRAFVPLWVGPLVAGAVIFLSARSFRRREWRRQHDKVLGGESGAGEAASRFLLPETPARDDALRVESVQWLALDGFFYLGPTLFAAARRAFERRRAASRAEPAEMAVLYRGLVDFGGQASFDDVARWFPERPARERVLDALWAIGGVHRIDSKALAGMILSPEILAELRVLARSSPTGRA